MRVEDPEEYHRFGDSVAADPSTARSLLARYENAFAETRSALPGGPDEAPAEAWLRRVRARFYDTAA